MKAVEEVVAVVVDYGNFICVAEKMAETYATVYYHSPCEAEFRDVRACVKGAGLDGVQRLDDPFDPDIFKTADLFIFPDAGFGGMQRYLREQGKAVWGNMGATDLELYRTLFQDTLKEVGLPTVKTERIQGLTKLCKYLKEHDDKWIKVNRFRGNMETWHHIDYAHSIPILDGLRVVFGGAQELVVFVAQDPIECDVEVGYDEYSVDGQFPSRSFYGPESKNEVYLGCVLEASELPEAVTTVNDAMASVLERYGYRCWWETEIRVKDGTPYFIDPTARMAGLTGEQQLETCTNLPEIIWRGAHGELVEPDFACNFAAAATLHYNTKASPFDTAIIQQWKSLEIPDEVARWIKLYHHCKIDGVYQFAAINLDELGVVLGVGDSVEESIDHLKENLEYLKGLPVHADVSKFADLLKQIKEAKDEGMNFGGEIPEPEIMLTE